MHYRDIGYFEEIGKLRAPDFKEGQNIRLYQEISWRYNTIKLIAKEASSDKKNPIEAKFEINKELGIINKLRSEL